MEEEEEEEIDNASNVFDYEDVEDLEDVVDYRPRGEVLSRIDESQSRERRANEKYPGRTEFLLIKNGEDSSFLTLDSLDEEADSDESGYVEAPPKSLLGQDDRKEEEEEESERSPCLESLKKNQSKSSMTICRNVKIDENENQRTKHENPEMSGNEDKTENAGKDSSLLVVDDNQRIKERERERADFKYPISETIRKLASASLRNSKSLEITSNKRLNALNNFKTSKSFDSVKADEITVESPSLHQRKQLLAQRGVMV